MKVDMIIENEPISADHKADLSLTVERDDLATAIVVLRLPGPGERSYRRADREGVDRGGRECVAMGVAAKVFETAGQEEINIEMISTIPRSIFPVDLCCPIPGRREGAARGVELGADAVRRQEPTGRGAPAPSPLTAEPRKEMDAWPHQRAVAAIDAGHFTDEILFTWPAANGTTANLRHRPCRDTSQEKLASLKPLHPKHPSYRRQRLRAQRRELSGTGLADAEGLATFATAGLAGGRGCAAAQGPRPGGLGRR